MLKRLLDVDNHNTRLNMAEMKIKDQPQPVFLGELIQSNDTAQIETVFEELLPVEMARRISSLNKADHIHLLEILGPVKSASIILKISSLGTANFVTQLPTTQKVSIVKEMSRD